MSVVTFGPKRQLDGGVKGSSEDGSETSRTVCASGMCLSAVVTKNLDGSCWADSSLSTLSYPEANRAILRDVLGTVEGFAKNRLNFKEIANVIRASLASHGETGFVMPVEETCPAHSPSRALFNAIARILDRRAEDVTGGYEPHEFMRTVGEFISLKLGQDVFVVKDLTTERDMLTELGSLDPATTRAAVLVQKYNLVRKGGIPLDAGDFSLVGVTMAVSNKRKSGGHSIALLRCNEDPTVWILNDALGTPYYDPTLGTIRYRRASFTTTYMSFTLEDYNFMDSNPASSWTLTYKEACPVVIRYFDKTADFMYARKDGGFRRGRHVDDTVCTRGACMNITIPVAGDRVTWADQCSALAGYNKNLAPFSSGLAAAPEGRLDVLADELSRTFRANGASVALTEFSQRSHSLPRATLDADILVAYGPKRHDGITYMAPLSVSPRLSAVAALVKLPNDRIVLILNCNESRQHWTVFDDGQRASANGIKRGSVAFVERLVPIFSHAKDLHYLSLLYGGRHKLTLTRGYECVVVYAASSLLRIGSVPTLDTVVLSEEERNAQERAGRKTDVLREIKKMKEHPDKETVKNVGKVVWETKVLINSMADESLISQITLDLFDIYNTAGWISSRGLALLRGLPFSPSALFSVAEYIAKFQSARERGKELLLDVPVLARTVIFSALALI